MIEKPTTQPTIHLKVKSKLEGFEMLYHYIWDLARSVLWSNKASEQPHTISSPWRFIRHVSICNVLRSCNRNISELCLVYHSPKFILPHRSKSKQIELGYQSWALKVPCKRSEVSALPCEDTAFFKEEAALFIPAAAPRKENVPEEKIGKGSSRGWGGMGRGKRSEQEVRASTQSPALSSCPPGHSCPKAAPWIMEIMRPTTLRQLPSILQ